MLPLRQYADPDRPASDGRDGFVLFLAWLAAIAFFLLWSLAVALPDLAPALAPDLFQPPPYQGYPGR